MGLPQSVQRRLNPEERYGLRVTLLVIAMVLVAVPFSYLLLEVLRDGPFTRFDRTTAPRLHGSVVDKPMAVDVLHVVSFLGKPLLLGIAIGLGALFAWKHHRRRLSLYLVVTAIGGGLVDSAVKIAVDRPRPEVEEQLITAFGKSFPSGHAMSSTVTYGALLLVFLPLLRGRRHKILAMVATVTLVVAIGLSRLFLGVHYVSDVLGGWVLGLAWLAGATAAFSIWRTETGRPPVHPTEGLEPEAAVDLRGDTSDVTRP